MLEGGLIREEVSHFSKYLTFPYTSKLRTVLTTQKTFQILITQKKPPNYQNPKAPNRRDESPTWSKNVEKANVTREKEYLMTKGSKIVKT